MSGRVTAYVRKGCKTCERALNYMKEKGVGFETVDLFQRPLTKEELAEIVRLLRVSPSELLRTRDMMYRELNLRDRHLSGEALLELMVEYPGLIKRPILMREGRAVLALKPEEVENLIPGPAP
ncbi:MAG: arsenate reductase family protein [Thermoplasmata archaeon]